MADGIRIIASTSSVTATLLATAALSDIETVALVGRATLYLQGRVRARASGRPGPRVQTGDYRRSIRTLNGLAHASGGALTPYGQVSTNAPQARRLEYGFVGKDILGRVYNQPAFPHWAPAVADTEKYIATQAPLSVVRTLSGGAT